MSDIKELLVCNTKKNFSLLAAIAFQLKEFFFNALLGTEKMKCKATE